MTIQQPRVEKLRLLVLGVLVVVLALLVRIELPALTTHGVEGPLTSPMDFNSFYCGGVVTALGQDPYRVEPLRSCENATLAGAGLRQKRDLVVPVSLPPFALGWFAALSLVMPFGTAVVLWLALTVASFIATVVALRALTGLPLLALAGGLALLDCYSSILVGQIVPLALAALALSALALQRGRYGWAAAGLAVLAVEPHLALAAWLAVWCFCRNARRPLLIAGAALVAMALAAGGPQRSIEYVTAYLPAHAHAEVVDFSGQYGLAALLLQGGVDEALSLRIASLSYLVMLAVGVVLAGRLARRFDDPAFLVVAPPAAVSLGGVYVHDHHLLLALPLGFLLLRRMQRGRLALVVALACLAMPWQSVRPHATPLASDRAQMLARTQVAMDRVPGDGRMADDVWRAFLETNGQENDLPPLTLLLFKIPVWLALVTLVAAAWMKARPPAHADA